MNMRQLEYIIAVANEGGVTEAAKKLYVSQPSLSQTIRTIEKEIGAQLFDRRTHPFQLTYAGRLFIEMATSVLNCQKNFLNEVNDIKDGAKGQIAIGITPKRGRQLIPYILPDFVKQFPKVEITLYEDTSQQLIALLLKSRIDLALSMYANPFYRELTYLTLFSEHLMLIVSKNSALDKRLSEKYLPPATSPVPLAEVKDEKFILVHRNHNIREAIDRIFDEKNFKPRIFLETHDSDLARELVAENLGVAVVPHLYPFSHISPIHPKLSYFFIDTRHATRNFVIAYRKDTFLTKAHREFIEICTKNFKDSSKHGYMK